MATPTFSVAAGTYTTTRSVTVNDGTSGAAIYYTTSGLAPTTSSTRYSGPITIKNTTKLRAIAALNGSTSATATALYTINPAATPTFSLAAGTYQTTQTVTISDTSSGASIYYTTSGLAPTTSSTRYSGPITVSSSIKLRALAAVPNGPSSAVFTAVYTIAPAATPTFSLAAGTYQTTQTVTISDASSGASIYYTTSGLAPTISSTRYSGPITVSSSIKLRALAAVPNGPSSAVFTAVYTIAPAATPTFSPAAGLYTGTQHVTISDTIAGAAIYYTTNGLAPTTSSARYTGPISIGSDTKLRAMAIFPNGPMSVVLTGMYTIRQSPTPVKPPNSSASFFGMIVHHLVSGTPWPSVPFGMLRLWDTRTLWANLNPTSGNYNWKPLDQHISMAESNNTKLIYTFGGTPPWAIPTNVRISSIARSGGVVTITTSGAHGMYYNSSQPANSQSQISVAGVSNSSFNGTFYITGTPSSSTLTYKQSGTDSTSSSGTISAVCSGGYVPTGCAEAPAHLSDWDEFVTQLAAHVPAGVIPYWEMWNEPNSPDFWKGDPKTLVAMTEDARRIIKAANSEAVILSPGVTGNYETAVECSGAPAYCGSNWLNKWLALGGKSYIDAVAFHGYPVITPATEQIQGAVNLLQGTLNQNGVGSLPLWDTESSWGPNSSLPDAGDQVAWVAKHLLLEESMGVQHSFWYAYDSTSWGILWSAATGLNRAGTAYELVEKWLKGTTLSGPCAQTANDGTTFVCSYTRANGYVAQAIWNTAGTKSFPVAQQFTQYRDLSGNLHGISGGTVQISTSPILVENKTGF